MASYTVNGGEQGAFAKTLVADTADTITFNYFVPRVEVYGDGTDALYISTDGSTPTVGAAATYFLPAGSKSSRTVRCRASAGSTTVVKVVSHGATVYSVSDAT